MAPEPRQRDRSAALRRTTSIFGACLMALIATLAVGARLYPGVASAEATPSPAVESPLAVTSGAHQGADGDRAVASATSVSTTHSRGVVPGAEVLLAAGRSPVPDLDPSVAPSAFGGEPAPATVVGCRSCRGPPGVGSRPGAASLR